VARRGGRAKVVVEGAKGGRDGVELKKYDTTGMKRGQRGHERDRGLAKSGAKRHRRDTS
jgi:hypothetical protein